MSLREPGVELHPALPTHVERPPDRLGCLSLRWGVILKEAPRIERVDADGREHDVVQFACPELFGPLLLLDESAVEPGNRLERRLHEVVATGRRGLHARHAEPAEPRQDAERDGVAGLPTRKPGPAAVTVPQRLEPVERGLRFVVGSRRVKQERDAGPGLLLIHRVADPRGLGEQRLHEIGVLLEWALQGASFSCGSGPLPLLEDLADPRVARGEMPGEAVGVEPRKEGLGALVCLFHDRRQREHGIPGRIRGCLHDERLAADVGAGTLYETVERHLPFARAPERHRHALADEHATRQHDQHRLFAIGRLAGRAGGEIAERLGAIGHLHDEHDRLRFAGGQIEGQLPRAVDEIVPRVVRPGVCERERHAASEPTGRGVAHLHGNLHDVAFAEESRHHRLHHQGFCRHAAIDDRAAAKACVVGEALELPGGERVWQRELDRDVAVLVRRERRQKERRLDHVFPWGRSCRGSGRRLASRLAGSTFRFVLLGLRAIAVRVRGFSLCDAIHRHRILR